MNDSVRKLIVVRWVCDVEMESWRLHDIGYRRVEQYA